VSVFHVNESQELWMPGRKLGPAWTGGGAKERTPNSEPRTERMTIAKTEITTLSEEKIVRRYEFTRA
jgi:hypothetical protein